VDFRIPVVKIYEEGKMKKWMMLAIVTHLKKGEDVRLKGLGKFYAKHRNAHKARNPKTGKQVDVPARNYLRFKAFDSGHAKLN